MLSVAGPYLERYNAVFCIEMVIIMAVSELFSIKRHGITKYSIAECVLYVILFLISLQVGLNFFNFVFIFLFIGKRLNFRKTANVHAVTVLSSLLIIIILAKTSIIPNIIIYEPRLREFLGFNQMNHAACFAIGAFMLRAYAAQDDMSIPEFLFWIVISYGIYTVTDSRLSWYSTILLCLLLIIQRCNKRILNNRFVTLVICMSFIISAIVSILLMLLYSPELDWTVKLNAIVNDRVMMTSEAFHRFGITSLGRSILSSRSEDPFIVDNFYIRILIGYGYIMFIAVFSLFTAAMFVAREKHDSYMLIMLMITAVMSLGETTLLFMAYNSFWFAIPLIFRALEENDKAKHAALSATNVSDTAQGMNQEPEKSATDSGTSSSRS